LFTILKRYLEKQEPSSRRDYQHFSMKLHPIKKITEVSPGTCLQSLKSWRRNRSVSSQLPLRTTSALDLLQRSTATLSSSLDLSTWCNLTSSVGRHTKMLVPISNTSWRFATHSLYQESPEMLYYFASSHSHCWESEAVVLRYKGEEYYVGTLLGILNANRKIRKRTDTDVAFTRDYSRVSIFHREHECTN